MVEKGVQLGDVHGEATERTAAVLLIPTRQRGFPPIYGEESKEDSSVKPERTSGRQCPCGGYSKVINVRHNQHETRRRRACRTCGFRWTTRERDDPGTTYSVGKTPPQAHT